MLAATAGVVGYWCQLRSPENDRVGVPLAVCYIMLGAAVLLAAPDAGRTPAAAPPVASRRRRWQYYYDEDGPKTRIKANMAYQVWKRREREAAKYILLGTVRMVGIEGGWTQKQIRDMARDDRRTMGGKPVCTIARAVELLQTVVDRGQYFRTCKANARQIVRNNLSQCRYAGAKESRERRGSVGDPGPRIRPSHEMRPGYLADLLDEQRRCRITDEIDAGAHGTAAVEWVASQFSCGIKIDATERHDIYAGRYKGWAATERRITITAQNLLKRDMPGGERVVGGLVTLGADRVPFASHEWTGIILWRATWLRKGRGIAYHTCSGVIAECAVTGETYHVDQHPYDKSPKSYELAARGLIRKLRRTPGGYVTMAEVAAVRPDDPRTVNWRIARACGFCEPGVQQFVAKLLPGKNYKRDEVALPVVLRLMTGNGYLAEARALVGYLRTQEMKRPA